MRLPNSYGSIVKLKGKRRRPFMVRKTVGYTDDGQQIRKIIGYAKTRDLAFQMLAEYNNDPYDIDLSKITFSKLYNDWIKLKEKEVENGRISSKRYTIYKSIKKYFLDVENLPFIEITIFHLEKIIENCQHGYDTKLNIKSLYNQLWNYAKLRQMPVKVNASENLYIGEKQKSDIHKPYTDNEINILWQNVENVDLIDTILICCYTSMRPSELLQIKTENVHLSEKYMIGGIKTKAGIDRIIPIADAILPLIKRRYNINNEYLIMNGNNKMSYRAYLPRFKEIISSLGMNHLPHDGRHYFATKMDILGANELCVKLIMGHIVKDITKDVYTHKELEDLLKTVNLLN